MKQATKFGALTLSACLLSLVFVGCSASMQEAPTKAGLSQIESPDGLKTLNSDLLGEAKKYVMPTNCVKTDKASIERGRLFFNELNNDSNVSAKYGMDYPKSKNFGNCVACHQIEKANGYGNIGPDLSKYHDVYVKTGARTPEWIFQKISDPRIDNKDTAMTVNLTTKLMSESEVCDIVSYIVADKK
jgi:sulfur-oxidizing protein SoxX